VCNRAGLSPQSIQVGNADKCVRKRETRKSLYRLALRKPQIESLRERSICIEAPSTDFVNRSNGQSLNLLLLVVNTLVVNTKSLGRFFEQDSFEVALREVYTNAMSRAISARTPADLRDQTKYAGEPIICRKLLEPISCQSDNSNGSVTQTLVT